MSDDTDTKITSFLIEGDTIYTAAVPTTVNFSYSASDNGGLGEFRFDISDDFSGLELASGGSNYMFSFTGSLSGSTASTGLTLDIFDSATAGPYKVTFDVIDAIGNSAEQAEVDLILTNPVMSVITLLSYTDTLSPDDTLFLTGTIDDLDLLGIEGINITLIDPSNVNYYTVNYDYSDTTVTTWDFNTIELDSFWIIVGSGAALGKYTLHIEGKDTEANFDVLEHEITVN